jgi:5S rRNA maturation endonuclease (ribonuclease M5)
VRTSIAMIYEDFDSIVLGIIEITDPDPNGANIRRTPDRSSNNNIISTALKGAQFPFFGIEQNAKTKENYYKLMLPDGRYGYVRTSIAMIYEDYDGIVLGIIEITDPDPNGANIRSTPDRSSSSNIINTASKGKQFPYYGIERNTSAKEDYYRLLLPDGRYGYVRTSIAKIVSDY